VGAAAGRVLMCLVWRTLAVARGRGGAKTRRCVSVCVCMCACVCNVCARFSVTLCLERLCVDE